MQSENKSILQAIAIAMEAEKKAKDFYTKAIANVSSSRGKDLLQQLADFEQNHYDKLNDLKISLQKDRSYIQYKGTHFRDYKAPSEVRGEIDSNKDELFHILGLAIDAEAESANRYRDLADKSNDVSGKAMFRKLVEEETLHRRILSDEYYQMQNRGGVWFWGD